MSSIAGTVIVLEDTLPLLDEPVVQPMTDQVLFEGVDLVPEDEAEVDNTDEARVCGREWTLSAARRELLPQLELADLDHPELDVILQSVDGQYASWLCEDVFICFEEIDVDGRTVLSRYLSKASKRGNDVYNQRQALRFKALKMAISGRDKRRKERGLRRYRTRGKTRMLFVTFTWAHGADYSIGEAWDCLGAEYHRWAAGMRRKYGRFSQFRVWEGQSNGYPHIHAMLVFDDHRFDTFLHGAKWRVGAEGEGRAERDAMADRWKHGFVDVQGVMDPRAGVSYVLKYVGGQGKGKDPHPRPGGPSMTIRTMSLCWLFEKRQFAMSGVFVDLIKSCTSETEKPEKPVKLGPWGALNPDDRLEGKSKWNMIGTVRLLMPKGEPPPWFIHLKLYPKLDALVVSDLEAWAREKRENSKRGAYRW